jgi:signal peptidase I
LWFIFLILFNCLKSGSMEPAFHRGDLLFLTNYKEDPVRVGDIVVFKVEGRDIPIVHRVLKLHEKYEILRQIIFY